MSRRNCAKDSTVGLREKSKDDDSAEFSDNYEIVEEECLETLSDDDVAEDLLQRRGYVEVEYVEEEEIEIEPRRILLPEISEGDEDVEEEEVEVDDHEDSDYVEEEDNTMNGSNRSLYSVTEVELDDDTVPGDSLNDSMFEEVMDDDDDDDEYVDDTIRDDDSEVDEVTVRETDDDDVYALTEQTFTQSCHIQPVVAGKGVTTMLSPATTSHYHDYETSPEDSSVDNNSSEDNDDDDGASAEELTEAIEYILRQEKAVSKFILTDEQAAKMAHLPIKVMKVIVDHLEVCDNDGTPIDWDFLLKIVLPFCDSEKPPMKTTTTVSRTEMTTP